MKVQVSTHNLARSPAAESGDACAAEVSGETVIAVLADGAGAARAGAEASRRIVDTFVGNYAARPRAWTPRHALGEFTRLINQTLYQESLTRFAAPELVSTLSVAVVEGNRLIGLNVGDSRVYLSRGGELRQLSRDHVDERQSHVLQRAIGLGKEVDAHCFETELRDGDMALLCSDGMSNVLDAAELRTQLAHRTSARALVAHARERATDETLDDISAVVINLMEAGKLRGVSELPLPIPETLRKGQVIDGYELQRPFADTDRVWLARKGDRRWTLKFAPVEARDHQVILEQFVKEAWNAERARGEWFVEAFTPEQGTARYYVQEFIEAPSLKTLLRSRALAIEEAIALGQFLAEASAQLLRLNLVHGDVKPENILVVSDYDRLRFKLVDLGSSAEIFSITSRAGTASYLAPERFRGASVSERTELFAIGVTLYEALTLRLPYGEIERFQTPRFHPAKDPAALNANIPPWLASVLLRAIAIEPVQRYQHYSEFAFDLAHPERIEPFHPPGAPLLTRDPLAFYRRGFFLLLVVAIFLLLRLLATLE